MSEETVSDAEEILHEHGECIPTVCNFRCECRKCLTSLASSLKLLENKVDQLQFIAATGKRLDNETDKKITSLSKMSQQVNEELEEAIRMKRRYLGELTNQLKIVSELKQRMSTMEVVHSSSK